MSRRLVSSVVSSVLLSFSLWPVSTAQAQVAPDADSFGRSVAIDTNVESSHRFRVFPVAEYLEDDPRDDWNAVVAGAALSRLEWIPSNPVWQGDKRGELIATYDSSLASGLFGFRLPRRLTERDAFTAAFAFVLDPDQFDSDPFGFAQISFGLWNTQTTGLNRTGDFASFAADTFELLELDYFPNVSPDFGGPYFGPSIFGKRTDAQPPDAFQNAAFAFGIQVPLPLGVPLLATIEHDPHSGVAVFAIHRIVAHGRSVPIPGAVNVVPLTGLALREYRFDAVGLTMWNDGFGGPTPAVHAKVHFHALVVEQGLLPDAGKLLANPGGRW